MTAAAQPRPVIVVRPMEPGAELPYVLATSSNALIETHGGKFARKEIFRDLVHEMIRRSDVQVACFEDDADVILGFAAWAPERVVELLYLRKSLSRMVYGQHEPLPIASEVTEALLGRATHFVRMRRTPPQGWAWRAMHACGYVPSIMPEAV